MGLGEAVRIPSIVLVLLAIVLVLLVLSSLVDFLFTYSNPLDKCHHEDRVCHDIGPALCDRMFELILRKKYLKLC